MPKINVTGQYWIDKNSKTEIVNFEFLNKKIPNCNLDEIGSYFCGRYFYKWYKADKNSYAGSKPVIANFHVEIVNEKEHEKSCRGEDIMQMSMDRLQDFACECGLLDVPTYNQSGFDLERSRKKAAYVYLRDVEGVKDLQRRQYDEWTRSQKDADGKIVNPFDKKGLQVIVNKTTRIEAKENDIINIINNLNRGYKEDYGEVTDLSTAFKKGKESANNDTEIIE